MSSRWQKFSSQQKFTLLRKITAKKLMRHSSKHQSSNIIYLFASPQFRRLTNSWWRNTNAVLLFRIYINNCCKETMNFGSREKWILMRQQITASDKILETQTFFFFILAENLNFRRSNKNQSIRILHYRKWTRNLLTIQSKNSAK